MKKFTAAIPALIVVLGFSVYFLIRPHAFYGDPVEPPVSAINFTLHNAAGPISLEAYKGKVILLYFGYTFCPDVCPTTLGYVTRALTILGPEKAREVQMLMITVDPERDNAQKLASYVTAFNPGFIGLTGTNDEIATVAHDYSITYNKNTSASIENYSVDHTASILVIDRNFELKLLIPYGNTPEQIADDLNYLLK